MEKFRLDVSASNFDGAERCLKLLENLLDASEAKGCSDAVDLNVSVHTLSWKQVLVACDLTARSCEAPKSQSKVTTYLCR